MLPSSKLVAKPYPHAQPNHQTVSGDLAAVVRTELTAFRLDPAGWSLRIRQTSSADLANHHIVSWSREIARSIFQTVSEESGGLVRVGRLASSG